MFALFLCVILQINIYIEASPVTVVRLTHQGPGK